MMMLLSPVLLSTLLIALTPLSSSFTLRHKCSQRCINPIAKLQTNRFFGELKPLMSTDDDEIEVNVADILEDTEEPEIMDILESEVVDMVDPEESEVVELDPHEVAVKALEAQIKSEILVMETKLKTERVALSKVKDRISESGKNGYFIVQAKVAEFQKVKVVEQKSRVTRNKREFVMKMLPVVDAFRAAPIVSPSSSEREISMHKSFGSLLESILVVFEKYGFSEYDAEIGGVLAPARHQVSEIIDGEVGGIIFSQSRRGMVDKDGEVVRRAIVVATKAPIAIKEVEVTSEEVSDAIAEDDTEESK